MLKPLTGKVSCFVVIVIVCLCFVSLAIPQFVLLNHINSLRLSSEHSGMVLTLRTDDATLAALPSPYSLVVDPSVWATSPLAVVVRHVFCGLFYFFFLLVMLPSEIPKLPTDTPQ